MKKILYNKNLNSFIYDRVFTKLLLFIPNGRCIRQMHRPLGTNSKTDIPASIKIIKN